MNSVSKLIVTESNNIISSFLLKNGEAERIFLSPLTDYSIGDIYIGRVQKVKKDLNAAFVEIAPGVAGFLSLSDVTADSVTNRAYDGILKENDHILVMVSKEPIKTKPLSLTCKISIQGQYSVIHNDGNSLSVSSKLPANVKNTLYGRFNHLCNDKSFGIILRTNAADADSDVIEDEISLSGGILLSILDIYKTRTVYSCLYKAAPDYIEQIRSLKISEYDCILTDSSRLYDEIKKYIYNCNLSLYSDTSLSIRALYSLDKHLSEATSAKVNLKSGAYLIIEPTEALTVIDVNTGKASSKSKDQIIDSINREAAVEIARQLILRNISGIIVIDFINYKNKEHEALLIDELKKLLKADPLQAKVIDITALGLIEITRQKN